jgi:Dolichyl-phosphate-mannose-protein mannosyltransferase
LIAKCTKDLHFDMAEILDWSRDFNWGYAKHPPFAPWLVRAWFAVVPFTDGTYYLLASIAATVGLWFAWKVAGLYLDPQKRVLGLVMLMLVPFYNFFALKLNANTILTPLWAATTWWFLKSLETRAVSYAVLAGLAAGLTTLRKYWSGVLIVALFLAALSHPHRKEYFSSSAPWITGVMGTLVFLPHLAWLVTHDFQTLAYAKASRIALTYGSALLSALWYLPKVAAYVAAPVLMLLAATRPSMILMADAVWPKDGTRRALLIAFAVPQVVAVLIAVPLNRRLVRFLRSQP